MWQALEAAFREARLVEPRGAKDIWCQALARLLAWWPPFFASVPEPAVNGAESSPGAVALSSALSPYIGVSDDFMGIVVGLHQAGIGLTLDRAVGYAGHDLLRMIRRFLETARGLKDARLWNQEWVTALSRIEAAITAQRLSGKGTSAQI
jgi:hypothetical protein